MDQVFGLKKVSEKEAFLIPISVLAYLGDAVYELFVRAYVVDNYKSHVKKMHQVGVKFVSATAQAEIVHMLIENELLTETEADIIRRGRNNKISSMPRNANIKEYRFATAFEALIGFLFISNQESRIEEIITCVINWRQQ